MNSQRHDHPSVGHQLVFDAKGVIIRMSLRFSNFHQDGQRRLRHHRSSQTSTSSQTEIGLHIFTANKSAMAGKRGLILPAVIQLLGPTHDYGNLQYFDDLGPFHEPQVERTLPTLQPCPTDIRARSTATSRLPHYRSTSSHLITQVRSVITPSSLQDLTTTPCICAIDPPPLTSSQHESTLQLSNGLFHQTELPSTEHNQLQYPTGISLPSSQPGGLRSSKNVRPRIPPTTMPRATTEFAERLSRIGVNVDRKSTSLEVRSKRLKNSIASKRFRERQKTRLAELEEKVKILTEERDHYRGLYNQLKETIDIKH
ncbi:conserved hypothetical protein [Histoplasma capsulatum H143]|uniref:BZIP domain-containing protein n=1 Tax=Ajellomyces capsulatus (strain H143) TaxID=544712 RepID=C6H5V7_AJECH|nr:conserved hypothetical protein [Histoplasma capsulatum H143]